MRVVATVALALCGLGTFAVGASAEEEAVSFPGGPLTVSVGPLGQCESSYAEPHGNNYFPPNSAVGDCGFFLAFPKAVGQPKFVEGKTFGFVGRSGPRLEDHYTSVLPPSPVTGAGTEASPYSEAIVFGVKEDAGSKTEYAQITETTTYVNGAAQFTSTYNVKNMTAGKVFFRAIYAGDLFVNGDDFGTGQFLGGPPRFIGGLNAGAGVLGGFIEAGGLPWSSFQEGCWNETAGLAMEAEGRCAGAVPTDQGIWHDVRSTVEQPHAFNETVEPAEVDNAAGVEWDQLREGGLAAHAEQAFTIINRTQVPSGLQISPTNQTLVQGQTETINVAALDLANQPYAGKILHYTVGGANPQSGNVTLNSAGAAQIAYIGHNAGLDTTQLFVDLLGSGVQAAGDPSGTATVTFLPLLPGPAPTPNSSYKVQSIHANSDGTITITLVPTQEGTATLEVTVPTATISRKDAIAAKKKKCKKNQVKIKGKCRPKTTVSGKLSATGKAGVALKLTVKPSSKVKKALKKGKTVQLTAKLTYKSKLGGTPTVQSFHLKVKGKKKKHH